MSSLLRSFAPSVGRSFFRNSIRLYAQAPSPASSIIPDFTASIYNQEAQTTDIGSIPVAALKCESSLVSVTLRVESGSRYETQETNGANFFLQHLAFTGKDQNGKSYGQLLEDIGALVNVDSTRENINYTVTCMPNQLDTVFGILANMTNSIHNISPDQIESIRNRVLQQKKAIESCKYNRSADHLHSIIYQQDAMGFTKEGSEDVLKTIDAKTLSNVAKKFYQFDRFAFGINGQFEYQDAFNSIKKHFSAQGTPKIIEKPAEPSYFGSIVTERDDSNDDVLVTIAFEGCGLTHSNYYPLAITRELIGDYNRYSGASNNHSGRLAELVATENYCDSFKTFNYNYSDVGVFGITMASQGKKLDGLVSEVLNDFVRLGHNARPGEVLRATNKLRFKILSAYEGSHSISKDFARFARHKITPPSLKYVMDNLDNITSEDVKSACAEHFMDVEPAIVGIGSTRNVPDYNQVRGWTHWWRL